MRSLLWRGSRKQRPLEEPGSNPGCSLYKLRDLGCYEGPGDKEMEKIQLCTPLQQADRDHRLSRKRK